MAAENCVIINGGTVSNVVFVDLATYKVPAGETIAPLGASSAWIGSTATESGGVWSFGAAPTPVLTIAQQAMVFLATGLTITSTSTAALDGTYATDAASQQHIQAEVTAILLNGTFTDGTTSLAWLDASGDSHTFTVAQFKAFATAVAAFVSACLRCANGQSTTLPGTSVVIP